MTRKWLTLRHWREAYESANHEGRFTRNFGRVLKILRVIPAIGFLLLVAGCALPVRIGNRPYLDALEGSLRLGQSAPADVLSVLGQPFAKGRAMLPSDQRPQTVWFYFYEERSVNLFNPSFAEPNRSFLFVYFDSDRYEGYIWFSSFPKEHATVLEDGKGRQIAATVLTGE
jgi:hypothetical protein